MIISSPLSAMLIHSTSIPITIHPIMSIFYLTVGAWEHECVGAWVRGSMNAAGRRETMDGENGKMEEGIGIGWGIGDRG